MTQTKKIAALLLVLVAGLAGAPAAAVAIGAIDSNSTQIGPDVIGHLGGGREIGAAGSLDEAGPLHIGHLGGGRELGATGDGPAAIGHLGGGGVEGPLVIGHLGGGGVEGPLVIGHLGGGSPA